MDHKSPSPASIDQARPVMNLQRSLDRMGGDRTLLHDLATFFLEDSGQLLTDLKAALEANDAKHAARSAHSLSGLAANFSADNCFAIGKAVEEACLKKDFESARLLLGGLQQEVTQLVSALRQQVLSDSPS